MSSESSQENVAVEVVVEVQSIESSEDPPMEEWSSLILQIPEENRKRLEFIAGTYHPGSGEICGKYVAMSDSSVFRHPYYSYPAVLDPGIDKALLHPEEKITYSDDGQELYIALCNEMNQCPVKIFLKGLLEKNINLRYYCVNPYGVRPMAIALEYNRIVREIDFTDNFLNNDACFHLGEMLTKNATLTDLNLSGCHIGAEGARQLFAGLTVNRVLRVLNLSKNQLGDVGGEYFATAILNGLDIKQIYLSYNQLGNKTAIALTDAFEFKNTLTHIDLSWNNLFSPASICSLLNRLEENTNLLMLNLAWNSLYGPRISNSIKNVMRAPNLHHLDLSSNKLQGEAITNIITSMAKAKKLVTLDLSANPMEPADALKVLGKMKSNAVKVQNLLMDNVIVDGSFITLLEQVKKMKSRKYAVITHGQIVAAFKPKGHDPRELVLNRAEFLATKSKKSRVDVALVFLQIRKNNPEMLSDKDFLASVKMLGAPLDNDLISEFVDVFPGPRSKKFKMINMKLLADYVNRKWPDRILPPTPPPEPEPEPEPEKTKKKDKGKGKGKK